MLASQDGAYKLIRRRNLTWLKVVRINAEHISLMKMAPFWRAPYGEINREIREWAYREGYIHIGWTADYKRKESLDTLDWVEDSSSKYYLTSHEIKEKILNFGKDSNGLRGGIILMHLDTKRTTDKPSSLVAPPPASMRFAISCTSLSSMFKPPFP